MDWLKIYEIAIAVWVGNLMLMFTKAVGRALRPYWDALMDELKR